MYVRIIQQLNTVDKNLKKNNNKKQFAVHDSDTPETLKQGQSHHTWYDLVDSMQGYNKAKFEKPCLNSAREKANHKVSAKSGNMSIISLEYDRKSQLVMDSWPAWCTQ